MILDQKDMGHWLNKLLIKSSYAYMDKDGGHTGCLMFFLNALVPLSAECSGTQV